jgi:hypothetical protein
MSIIHPFRTFQPAAAMKVPPAGVAVILAGILVIGGSLSLLGWAVPTSSLRHLAAHICGTGTQDERPAKEN